MTLRQMIKVKTVLQIFGIALAVGMFAKACNSPALNEGPVKSDTVVEYKTHIDTVFFTKEVIKTVAKIVSKRDTIYIDTATGVSTKLNVVDTEICDSLIEGTISTVLDGTIVAQNFKYKPLFPKYIIKTDSIFTTITNEAPLKNKLYLGLAIGGTSNKIELGPSIILTTKKEFLLGYNYGIINNTHNVTLGYKLFK